MSKVTTVDKISIQRIGLLHPLIRQEALDLYSDANKAVNSEGLYVRITATSRTLKDQANLYAIGRTTQLGKPVVTFARPAESYHHEQWSLAQDFVLIKGKEALWNTGMDLDADKVSEWMEVVNVYEKAGWEAGVRWAGKKCDPPHVQRTLGYSISELRELRRLGKFRPDGYLDL